MPCCLLYGVVCLLRVVVVLCCCVVLWFGVVWLVLVLVWFDCDGLGFCVCDVMLWVVVCCGMFVL